MGVEQNDNKIKIAVDALAVRQDNAGGFRVLVGLIPDLVQLCDFDFVLYVTWPDIERALGRQEGRLEYVYAPNWAHTFVGRFLWQQCVFPKLAGKAGCSLIYSASGYPEIFTKMPIVTHQQNLWSFASPQLWWPLKSLVKSFLRRQVAKIALRRSSANVFISDYLRNRANLIVPKASAKNFTVPNATPSTNLIPKDTFTEEWANKDYCLAVGSFVVHKNYLTLIRTFKLVANECQTLYLIIVGNFTNKYGKKVKRLCKKLKLNDKIIFTGALDFEKVINLYQRAKFSVNISLLEGFGLPVLESMSVGCPVICSDIPAFHEIGAESVLYCNPRSPKDIGEKMTTLYRNKTRRKDLSVMGFERSKCFSWHQSAARILDIFKFALGGHIYETNYTES